MALEQGQSSTEILEIGGVDFYIRAEHRGDEDYDAWSMILLPCELIRDTGNPANLINGVAVKYSRSRYVPNAKLTLFSSLITNTSDRALLEEVVFGDASIKTIFGEHEPSVINLGDAEMDYYRSLHPGFLVLDGTKHDVYPLVGLNICALNLNSVEAELEPFNRLIEFLAKGTLVADKKVAEAMSEAVKGCIPSFLQHLEGGAPAIEDRPATLPGDWKAPGTRILSSPGGRNV